MATIISMGQEVITCDLCDKPTQQFCNNCQVRLCVDCVSKHVDKHQSFTHDIVPFKNRKIQLVFSECEFHPHQKCEAYCQQCDVPVCIKCFLGNHKWHDAVELSNIVANKKQEIEKETMKIETVIIPKLSYQKSEVDTKSKTSKCAARYNELEQKNKKQRQLWHNEVETIFNKLDSLIKSMKDKNLAALNTIQATITSLIPEMKKTVEENKEILKTNRMSQVTNYKSKLTKYSSTPTDIDVKITSLQTNTVPGIELSIELGEYKATLTQTSLSGRTEDVSNLPMGELLDEARVITTIPTVVKPIWRVACIGADVAWVSGDDIFIRLIDIHGSVHDTVKTTCMEKPNDITVTRQGDLVYSDAKHRTVNIVRHGRIEVMIALQKGWKPRGLCCTRLGDILVNLFNGSQNKIVRYQGQAVKEEIYKDNDKKEIFKTGEYRLCLAENYNGDICVSDLNADMVVVLDKAGRVRFRYDGTPARRREAFDPRKIVTDSMSRIIVADYRNNFLHILDQNGQFLRCVDNCGLNDPFGLSVDSKGRLWVGLTFSEKVRVIQYTK